MKTQFDLVVVVPFEVQSCFLKLFRCGCLLSLLLNGALPVFESSTLFSSQNQPTSSPNLLSLQVQNHPLSNPSFSFLFIFNNINLLFPLIHSAVISSFYMQPRFLFEAMISLPLMRTLPKTFTPTFQCIHLTMHPRKSSNYSIPCDCAHLPYFSYKISKLID